MTSCWKTNWKIALLVFIILQKMSLNYSERIQIQKRFHNRKNHVKIAVRKYLGALLVDMSITNSSSHVSTNRIIIIDVEATCWNAQKAKGRQSEIIEIGAVLVDSALKSAASEFDSLIRLHLNPELSEFCTQLTSIRQEDINGARHFQRSGINSLYGPGRRKW